MHLGSGFKVIADLDCGVVEIMKFQENEDWREEFVKAITQFARKYDDEAELLRSKLMRRFNDIVEARR